MPSFYPYLVKIKNYLIALHKCFNSAILGDVQGLKKCTLLFTYLCHSKPDFLLWNTEYIIFKNISVFLHTMNVIMVQNKHLVPIDFHCLDQKMAKSANSRRKQPLTKHNKHPYPAF